MLLTLVAGTLLAFGHAYVPPATPQLFSLASCPVACPCIPRTRSRAVGGTLEASKRSGGGERRDRSSKGRVLRIALEEMYEGVELQGIIRSVKDFGAFVDVGSTTDGLLHVNDMLPQHRQYSGNKLCVSASEGEAVLAEVTKVDLKTRKFNLREVELVERRRPPSSPAATADGKAKAHAKAAATIDLELTGLYEEVLTGDENLEDAEQRLRSAVKRRKALEKWAQKMRNKGHWTAVTGGVVTNVLDYGCFVEMSGREGLLHASEMIGSAISRGGKVLVSAGDKIQVRVLAVDLERGHIQVVSDSACARVRADAVSCVCSGMTQICLLEHNMSGFQLSMKPWSPSPEEESADLWRQAPAEGRKMAEGEPESSSQLQADSARNVGERWLDTERGDETQGNAFAAAFRKAIKDTS